MGLNNAIKYLGAGHTYVRASELARRARAGIPRGLADPGLGTRSTIWSRSLVPRYQSYHMTSLPQACNITIPVELELFNFVDQLPVAGKRSHSDQSEPCGACPFRHICACAVQRFSPDPFEGGVWDAPPSGPAEVLLL
ncbi:MAG: hypothetical protein MJE68_17515 [Proteobacteria bacterium]|nr:hypothetical protein [Pseudomonadota bacterium]